MPLRTYNNADADGDLNNPDNWDVLPVASDTATGSAGATAGTCLCAVVGWTGVVGPNTTWAGDFNSGAVGAALVNGGHFQKSLTLKLSTGDHLTLTTNPFAVATYISLDGGTTRFTLTGEIMPQSSTQTISATNALTAGSNIVMNSGNHTLSLRVAAPSDADVAIEIWGMIDSSDSTGQVVAAQNAIAQADIAGGKGNPSNGWAAVPKGTTRRFVIPLPPGPFYAYVPKVSHNNSDNAARNVSLGYTI